MQPRAGSLIIVMPHRAQEHGYSSLLLPDIGCPCEGGNGDITNRREEPDHDGYDFEKDVQAFCARKYTSDFSLEMTRSAEVYLQEFLGCESIMREARTNDMQQLLLMVTYTAQPGTREQFVNEVTASGVLDIIRHEDGCLGYAYYYDAENADKVILIEQWQSQEQQQIHMTQPHMTQLMTIKDQYIVDTKVQKGLC